MNLFSLLNESPPLINFSFRVCWVPSSKVTKTSTGKIQPAATMPVTLVMLQAINDHYLKTGQMIGMKPAGGISTAKVALQYLVMLHETLGNKWLDNHWFRFGASSLANDIILQLGKEEKGVYYSKDYISND